MKLFMSVFMVSVLFISAPSSAEKLSEPTAVLDAFRTALTEGDTEVVKDVLSDDVLIFEGGGVERSLAEYSAHHLKSDIKFSQAVPSQLLERTVQAADGLAVITSRYSVSGEYNGREVDLTMNETVTVSNSTESGWKIIRIHWSN
ncbi:nuclear transport factor 2 family protein [Pseudidiomarina tainanensis]|uniref:SnoaL-like domain-containing protein n=2 Tax=Pseudidiomarina TaxID=2800384 RepID=A0A1I6G9S9_9GAMM|nr:MULTISPECIES: nuclear transport factor 2 family protein [Pseudidiomarina]RZQ56971.1 nuclear transport factor 2 family protein [Pseudidiomarina tainanensis]SFR38962.1 SnoaL-like domain-containing protein [Pseudidiomarina maritima]